VLRDLEGVYLRRFQLRDTALEVFFNPKGSGGEGDSGKSLLRSLFVDFGSRRADGGMRRDAFARWLMHLAPSACACEWPSTTASTHRPQQAHGSGSWSSDTAVPLVSEEAAARHWRKVVNGWTARWQRREIGNFEYLMALNTLAGRSFNDLCQYPVMPWILNDYRTRKEAEADVASEAEASERCAVDQRAKQAARASESEVVTHWNEAASHGGGNGEVSGGGGDGGDNGGDEEDCGKEDEEHEENRSACALSEAEQKLKKVRFLQTTRANRGKAVLESTARAEATATATQTQRQQQRASSPPRRGPRRCWPRKLDLGDPSVFRDLSKPMGALDEKRLRGFRERFELFDDPDIPSFMYGSHYSTCAGVVLHYLVRLEPFSSLHVELQGGRFDVADRLFKSVSGAWHQCTDQGSEVKELTPEWFSAPAFLHNSQHNRHELGQCQDGTQVGDVELPYWAVSAEDFVGQHRAALESEHVSARLHEWVDLVFGHKQRGKAAEEANNVFYYLTYFGLVDISAIEDPVNAHIGQCPRQLFASPHPSRHARGRHGPRDGLLRRRCLPGPLYPYLTNTAAEGGRAGCEASEEQRQTHTENANANGNGNDNDDDNWRPLFPSHAHGTLSAHSPSPRYPRSSPAASSSVSSSSSSASVLKTARPRAAGEAPVLKRHGVAALRVGNGVCVAVDGSGLIDVLHWEVEEVAAASSSGDGSGSSTLSLEEPTQAQEHAGAGHAGAGHARAGHAGAGHAEQQQQQQEEEQQEQEEAHGGGAGEAGEQAEQQSTRIALRRLEPSLFESNNALPRLPPTHCPPPHCADGGGLGSACKVAAAVSASARFVVSGGVNGQRHGHASLSVQQLDLVGLSARVGEKMRGGLVALKTCRNLLSTSLRLLTCVAIPPFSSRLLLHSSTHRLNFSRLGWWSAS